jgi:hypothetical protein
MRPFYRPTMEEPNRLMAGKPRVAGGFRQRHPVVEVFWKQYKSIEEHTHYS